MSSRTNAWKHEWEPNIGNLCPSLLCMTQKWPYNDNNFVWKYDCWIHNFCLTGSILTWESRNLYNCQEHSPTEFLNISFHCPSILDDQVSNLIHSFRLHDWNLKQIRYPCLHFSWYLLNQNGGILNKWHINNNNN